MKKMLLLLVIGLSVGAHADTDYESMPGYVNLANLDLPEDVESTTDVFIKKPLLKLVSIAIKSGAKKDEDRELAEILSQL
ncbi:MAG: hypothetical protein QGG64_23430, partial [Candidatus Latescibacteria bacterium]|nr:hypothetical protein [Candidatus Latescibacterota bacterium]